MTLILSIIRDNQCIMCGDLRRTFHETGNFLDDTYKVYSFKENKTLLIGFAGDVDLSTLFFPFIMSKVGKSTTVDACAKFARRWLRNNTNRDSDEFTIVITGKGDTGKPTIAKVSTDSGDNIEKKIGGLGLWKCIAAYNNVNPHDYIVQNLDKVGNNINDLADFAYEVNRVVSNEDGGVAAKCYVIALEL